VKTAEKGTEKTQVESVKINRRELAKARKSLASERELSETISSLQSLVESAASTARIYFDLGRELVAKHRRALLDQECGWRAGTFEEQQGALLEEHQELREILLNFADFRLPTAALREIMALRNLEPSHGMSNRLRPQCEDAVRTAAQVMFTWGELMRLCDSDALPPMPFQSDAPDLVAAAASQAVPSEQRINQIVAAGTTCIALMKEFCARRGIEVVR
jgi:hypothetical protein